MMSVYSSKLSAPSSNRSANPTRVTQDTNSTLTKRKRHARVGWNINEHVCSADSTPRAEPKLTRNHVVFGLFGMLMTVFVFTVCWSESEFRVEEHRRLEDGPQPSASLSDMSSVALRAILNPTTEELKNKETIGFVAKTKKTIKGKAKTQWDRGMRTIKNGKKEDDGRLVFGGIRAGLQGAVGGAVAGAVGALSFATKTNLVFDKKEGEIWCHIPQSMNWDDGFKEAVNKGFSKLGNKKEHDGGVINAKVTAIDSLQNTKWKAKGNKFARNFTIRFEGACDRVIEYRSLKKEADNILNMINTMKWINANNPNLFKEECTFDKLIKELESKDTFVTKPKGYKNRGDKRRLASSWTPSVLRYAMDSIENMAPLDRPTRASRLSFE